MTTTQLSPRRPYLLRAFYEWLLDNQLTPHIVVDVNLDGVIVPMEFVQDGQMVLNIAPSAVVNLILSNTVVQLHACFGGVPRQIVVPIYAILAIYARENGAGTIFVPELAYTQLALANDDYVNSNNNSSIQSEDKKQLEDLNNKLTISTNGNSGGRPILRVVK